MMSAKATSQLAPTTTKSEHSPNATQKQRTYSYTNTLLSASAFNKKAAIKNGTLVSGAQSGGKFTAIKYPKLTISLMQHKIGSVGTKTFKKFNTGKKNKEEQS